MPVKFSQLRAYNMDAPLSVEKIFRLYGSWAGIHDFLFDAHVSLAEVVVEGDTGEWQKGEALISTLPPNFSFSYHKTQLRQAIYITGESIDLTIGTNSSGHPFVLSGGSSIQYLPVVTPTEADVTITFRQQQNETRDNYVSYMMSLYMNGRLYFSFAMGSNDLEVIGTLQLGFSAYNTDTVMYTNVIVPELAELAEFGTLDPGENAIGGLQRTIEGRYLKYFVRFDGTLIAWRKRQRLLIHTFVDPITGISRNTDLPQLITHARMRGAYVEGEFHDPLLTAKYMHRFAEVDNSMIMTEEECYDEARNTVRRSEESAFRIGFEANWIPVLEPEDRISILDSDYVIDSFTINASKGKTMATYNARKYVWGDPVE